MKRPAGKPQSHTVTSARAAALQIVAGVLDKGRPLDDILAEAGRASGLFTDLEARDRAFARLLSVTVLRRLGQIDDLLAHCLDRPLAEAKPRLRNILRLGAAQLVFIEVAGHAAVDETVRLAGREKSSRGLVNAVLRRITREGKTVVEAQDAARLNTPDWLWRSWAQTFGEAQARAVASAHLAEPPLDLTVASAATAAEWVKSLDAEATFRTSLRRGGGGRIEDLPGYADGAWWVQDAAATLPARLLLSALDDPAGAGIIDLCAAPGGKTAQLAAAGARVTAVDRSGKRLGRVSENLARLGLEADLVTADAADWRPDVPADAVLLDAPCTATGTLRRHPDAAYLKSPSDVARMAAVQARLAEAARDMLRPGGVLVYCTCSLQAEEGEAQAARLVGEGFERLAVSAAEIDGFEAAVTGEGDLRTLPSFKAEKGGMDGFFAARLRRIS